MVNINQNQMNKTIIISNPKITLVSGNYDTIAKIAEENPYTSIDPNDPQTPVYREVWTELVKARRFHRQTGNGIETWLVGFDKRICEILEILPTDEYEELEKLRETVDDQKYEIGRLSKQIENWQNASFWTKLKWLFSTPS
jgi:hypothetical protein